MRLKCIYKILVLYTLIYVINIIILLKIINYNCYFLIDCNILNN